MTSEEELIYWSGIDFCEIIDPIIDMSTTYGDERMIEVLNRYLNDKMSAA